MRAGYLGGQSIAGPVRDRHVSRGAIRTAVTDLMPEHTADHQDAPISELPVALDMPGKVADFLRTADLEPAEQAALDQGVTVRRGQGVPAVPAQRKARRECENRVSTLAPTRP